MIPSIYINEFHPDTIFRPCDIPENAGLNQAIKRIQKAGVILETIEAQHIWSQVIEFVPIAEKVKQKAKGPIHSIVQFHGCSHSRFIITMKAPTIKEAILHFSKLVKVKKIHEITIEDLEVVE